MTERSRISEDMLRRSRLLTAAAIVLDVLAFVFANPQAGAWQDEGWTISTYDNVLAADRVTVIATALISVIFFLLTLRSKRLPYNALPAVRLYLLAVVIMGVVVYTNESGLCSKHLCDSFQGVRTANFIAEYVILALAAVLCWIGVNQRKAAQGY